MLKYFRTDEEPKARVQSNFIEGFLEVMCSAEGISGRSPDANSQQGRN